MTLIAMTIFFILILLQLPLLFTELSKTSKIDTKQVTLDQLIKLRSDCQVSANLNIPKNIPSWRNDLAELKLIHSESGLPLLPIIDHLIQCERDEQNLFREFEQRAATAKTASITLILMPLLMWAIAATIGVDVFGFLKTPAGLLCLLVATGLTILSRFFILKIGRVALQKPTIDRDLNISSSQAATITFISVLILQTTFIGFLIATITSCVVHFAWQNLPMQSVDELEFLIKDKQHFQIVLLSALIETGISWGRALELLRDADLSVLKGRIDMGVSAEKAFKSTVNWQKIGSAISNSIERGTEIANDLRVLADEYRQDAFSYRISRIEKFAGRLVIPVNLLQLPAFMLAGLVPVVAPLVLETLSAFHI